VRTPFDPGETRFSISPRATRQVVQTAVDEVVQLRRRADPRRGSPGNLQDRVIDSSWIPLVVEHSVRRNAAPSHRGLHPRLQRIVLGVRGPVRVRWIGEKGPAPWPRGARMGESRTTVVWVPTLASVPPVQREQGRARAERWHMSHPAEARSPSLGASPHSARGAVVERRCGGGVSSVSAARWRH